MERSGVLLALPFQDAYRKVAETKCVYQLKGHITPVRTLTFSSDGLSLVSGGLGGLINIWSLRVSRVPKSQNQFSVPPSGVKNNTSLQAQV